MILVNLLPAEFRRDATHHGPSWPKKNIARAGAIVFLALTGIFYIQYLFGMKTLKGLESRRLAIQQDLQRVDRNRMEMEAGSKGERTFLENYAIPPFQTTSILSSVSQTLPNSIWIVELKVLRLPKDNTLLLKGVSLPSGEKSSVHEIEKYLRDLKDQFPGNAELVLTTSRQQKERMELTLFTAVFKW
jgi:hypothetical protein